MVSKMYIWVSDESEKATKLDDRVTEVTNSMMVVLYHLVQKMKIYAKLVSSHRLGE